MGSPGRGGRADAPFRIPAACLIATLAFWAYTQTLLPGVDLGDTAGFQAAVLWPEVSARQAYPLYYTLARPFVRSASADNPARALNLFSAIWGAVAVGLLTYVCARATRSLLAGVAAGLLLAFSYTFWSQAIIAEVYTLHLALIGACLLALAAYKSRPEFSRLLVFFAVYALAFGNHLTTILLLPPFTLFLFLVTPDPRDLLRPRVMGAAMAIAMLGAVQYLPNFLSEWNSLPASGDLSGALSAFWFDTTKQDWRETMVMGVTADQASDRIGMWLFDARQQFGITPLVLAVAGIAGFFRIDRPWAWLLTTMYAFSAGFALTYNVGDSHVFFLPAHFATAFAVGAGTTVIGRALSGAVGERAALRSTIAAAVALSVVGYGGWRAWTTWPAIDRHDDRRGERLLADLASGVREGNAILVTQVNWQLENVLLYTGRHLRDDLGWVRLGDVMTHWPLFVADNHRVQRDIVLDGDAARAIAHVTDPGALIAEAAPPPLDEMIARVPRGMPYVLVRLAPPRDMPLDEEAFERGLAQLSGGRRPRTPQPYELWAGVAGESPQIYRSSRRPFSDTFSLLEERLTVRMDSWLPTDTFRRAGFGHVLRDRERLMVLERGINLVWLGQGGRPSPPYYAASLFAPQPRFRLPAATLEYAAGRDLSAAVVGAKLEGR